MIPIAEALADIGAPVSPVPYRGSEDAFVTYQCIGQTGQIYAEGVEAETGVAYAVDIFTNYGSDADATLSAGYEVRHGLIGPGVFASHGYERSHKKGVLSTLKLLDAFVG